MSLEILLFTATMSYNKIAPQ